MRVPLRVVVAKPGLDGHDRGAKVVAKALKEAGMEVIYTGRHQTVDSIASVALQEDADAIGLSVLSGAHMDYCGRLVQRLREAEASDIVLTVGGTIPESDRSALKELGFRVFATGSRLADIVDYLNEEVGRRRRAPIN
ncbi:MAG: cobalamin B12-binding domain-containing protein [Candidatus Dormibacteraeota bacterium]|uniref:Cobalamin B12-binding domain-containing protein n=1 Tax=Candidatus Dormiibacter inghamiae TaxID=3127013 RepID=A0A934KA23_9BACT|nr:cobalamin B12-binding domain-containing protein [Candidatus Dormibacteraeota bacterium]MBJ7606818.1 cobalamin B12-binding domain-containing protein [Candidatus Dormibacteraeota bacterium]